VIDVYRNRAERSGQSMEEEVRQALTNGALAAQHSFGDRARVLREKLRAQHGEIFDSVDLVNTSRDDADGRLDPA
jgi:plasmid stability protein